MKLSLIASGIVLAVAAQGASAAISKNPGDLFLEVWNGDTTSNGKSFVMKLGITAPTFLDGPAAAAGSTTWNAAGDANWNLGTISNAFRWAVYAANDDGYASLGNVNYDYNAAGNYTGILTTAAPGATVTAGNSGTYSSYTQANGTLATMHIGGINQGASWTGSKGFGSGDNGYFYASGSYSFGPDMNGNLGFNTVTAPGNGQLMYFLTDDQNEGISALGKNGVALGTWTLSNSGVLSFAAPGAPVPVPAAVWLFGSAMAGFATMSKRRKTTA